jgi:hypothetical protein
VTDPNMTETSEAHDEAAKTIAAATEMATNSRNDQGSRTPEEPIMKYFAWKHLPVHLQAVSTPFCDLAEHLIRAYAQLASQMAKSKLLEGKDAAVRAALP